MVNSFYALYFLINLSEEKLEQRMAALEQESKEQVGRLAQQEQQLSQQERRIGDLTTEVLVQQEASRELKQNVDNLNMRTRQLEGRARELETSTTRLTVAVGVLGVATIVVGGIALAPIIGPAGGGAAVAETAAAETAAVVEGGAAVTAEVVSSSAIAVEGGAMMSTGIAPIVSTVVPKIVPTVLAVTT